MRRLTAQELTQRYANGERAFCKTNLSNVTLRHAKLRGIDLSQSDLTGVDLRNADLRDANFSEANLSSANLRSTRCDSTNFSKANLHSANLQNAYFFASEFGFATLCNTNLTKTKFYMTDLSSVTLDNAVLNQTELFESTICLTDFSNTQIKSAKIGWTVFAAVRLGPLCSAPIEHYGPSYIDWLTITKSHCEPQLGRFLVQTGIPHVAAMYMAECAQAASGKGVLTLMRSTFISYGKPDESFARKLYEALCRNGVKTFFFPENAIAGEKLHRLMRKGINSYDRVILVCSKESLIRKGVLNEIEETLTREARDGGETYLIPIRLDDYLFHEWQPSRLDIAQAIKDRVVADFSNTHKDHAQFDIEFEKLLRALKKSDLVAEQNEEHSLP